MKASTKILLLEDNADDAYIIQHQLLKEKQHFAFHIARDKESYIQALEEFHPDIILSDHSLPQFNSSDALAIARERFPKIPFIMITGTISEELATTIVKSGADDFILKDRLGRLPAAVESALHKRRLEQEKQEAVDQLIRSEAKYRTLFVKSPLPKWIYDAETLKFLEVNEAAIQLYGYSAEEFLRMTITDIRPRQDMEQLSNDLSRLRQQAGTRKSYRKHLKKNGEYILVETTAHFIDYNQRQARIVIVNDITERKKVEESLRTMEQEVLHQKVQAQKKIIRAILEAQEKERNHIGRELHDNVNQILASTKMHLGHAAGKNAELKELVSYPMHLIENAIQEIRSLTHGHVTPLKNVPLKELMEGLLETLPAESNIRTELTYLVNEEKLDDELRLHLYRILQEQLNNIVRYAEAKNIRITLTTDNDVINLLVADDGQGFDPAHKRKGIGLSNMLHRIESFNGEMMIDSAPGRGCTIRIRIPCGAG